MSARPVIVCFAGDTWEGNPHSRHHLMRRFARTYDVLFVEGVPMRTVALGDRHELRRVAAKLRGFSLREAEPGLHVLRPLPIPPAGRAGRLLQTLALRAQVGYALRRLRLRGPRVAWFSLPNAAPLRGRLKEVASVLYYQDRYDAFSHVDAERLQSQIAELARSCDLAFASAAELMADLEALGAEPILVPHGVDADHFARELPPPDDLAGLERPLVGYVGIIDDYLCFDSLVAIADSLERGTVVMVGHPNTDVTGLQHPRIRLLGRRPYEEMPGYMHAFDCCVVPFQSSRLTRAVNPIKLREYLAAGRPVVATALPEIAPYDDVVETAQGPEDFANLVLQVLTRGPDTRTARDRRRQRVASESWAAVADRIDGELRRVLAARETATP